MGGRLEFLPSARQSGAGPCPGEMTLIRSKTAEVFSNFLCALDHQRLGASNFSDAFANEKCALY